MDVQANRFVVQTLAWGRDLEFWVIDRFDLTLPPEDAPGAERDEHGQPRRQLSPARYAEDWQLLEPLEAKVYPVEGETFGLRPLAVTCDAFGEPGVTEKARKFWRAMKQKGKHARFPLVAGSSRDYGNRVDRRYPEIKTKDRNKRKQTRRKSDVPIAFMVTNRLKDEIAASLLREEAGPGKLHLTRKLGRAFFEEICAEERLDGQWSMKSGQKRNEAFDLAYHGKALVVLMLAEEIDWENPAKPWAIDGLENVLAVPLDQDEQPEVIDTTEGLSSVEPEKSDAPAGRSLAQRRAAKFAAYAAMRTGNG